MILLKNHGLTQSINKKIAYINSGFNFGLLLRWMFISMLHEQWRHSSYWETGFRR